MAISEKLIGGVGLDGSVCAPWLENCDDSIGAYVPDGDGMLFINWLRPRPAMAVTKNKVIIPYIGAEGNAAGTPTSGVPATICALGDGVEVGQPCRFTIETFGHLKRRSDPLLSGGNIPYCEKETRKTVDGVVITNDDEWHERKNSLALMHDINMRTLHGIGPASHSGVNNANNPTNIPDHWGIIPLLDGTAQNNGYANGCDWNRAKVLDWNGAAVTNAAPVDGITLDGAALDDVFRQNLYATLESLYYGLRNLFRRMPHLNAGGMQFGDIALFMPQEAIECFVTGYACFKRCDDNATRINNQEARVFYDDALMGGIGYGEIAFGNTRIPIIPHNPHDFSTNRGALVNADGTFNAMFLWRGSVQDPLLGLEYNNLSVNNTDPRKETRDMGAFEVGKLYVDDCIYQTMRHEWRYDFESLCLQTLIKNVACPHIAACVPDMSVALDDC